MATDQTIKSFTYVIVRTDYTPFDIDYFNSLTEWVKNQNTAQLAVDYVLVDYSGLKDLNNSNNNDCLTKLDHKKLLNHTKVLEELGKYTKPDNIFFVIPCSFLPYSKGNLAQDLLKSANHLQFTYKVTVADLIFHNTLNHQIFYTLTQNIIPSVNYFYLKHSHVYLDAGTREVIKYVNHIQLAIGTHSTNPIEFAHYMNHLNYTLFYNLRYTDNRILKDLTFTQKLEICELSDPKIILYIKKFYPEAFYILTNNVNLRELNTNRELQNIFKQRSNP